MIQMARDLQLLTRYAGTHVQPGIEGAGVIEGPDFVWLHMPRCAGAAADRRLRARWGADTRYLFDRIDQGCPARHDTLADRHVRDPGFALAGRRIVCNIRRLPSWVLANRIAAAPAGVPGRPDDVLRRYATPRVDAWIRVEHLSRDLARVFDLPESDPAIARFETAPASAAAALFTAEELQALYAANPRWAGLEASLYGSLLEAGDVQKVA
jgi:hypothetical protein